MAISLGQYNFPLQRRADHSITAILSTGTFDEEDLAEFAETLVAGRLDNIYVLD